MAMFSAMVALAANDTRAAEGAPRSRATLSRASYTAMPASMDASCTPRPTPPNDPMARATASATSGGFARVVAALSK